MFYKDLKMKILKFLTAIVIVASLSGCAAWHEMWGQPYEANTAPPIDENSVHSNYPGYETPGNRPTVKKKHVRPEYYELPSVVTEPANKP